MSFVKLLPPGGDQLKGVAVVLEGDPVGAVDFMRTLYCNLLWCSDGLICNIFLFTFRVYTYNYNGDVDKENKGGKTHKTKYLNIYR